MPLTQKRTNVTKRRKGLLRMIAILLCHFFIFEIFLCMRASLGNIVENVFACN